jgi:hypothetical protein
MIVLLGFGFLGLLRFRLADPDSPVSHCESRRETPVYFILATVR